jgi:hypothetical protein
MKFNKKIDQLLLQAGGKLYLANLDRPALENFIRIVLEDIEAELITWRDAKDEHMMNDKFWDGYVHGMVDAIVAVRTWGQDIE